MKQFIKHIHFFIYTDSTKNILCENLIFENTKKILIMIFYLN